MAITPPYNDIEMTTAWAEDAATTIPSVPVPGVSYRNTGISEETIAQGQQYDNIGRSADWNQLLYKISANIVTMQKEGAGLLWVSGRTYEQGSLVKDPDNAQIYYRLKAGAGTTKPAADSTNWQLLQSFFMGEGLVLVNNKLNWGLTNTTVSDCNAITTSGVYRATSSTENIPTDTATSSAFNGIIVCLHTGTILQQIAYETTNSGAFSMNTRISINSGDTWSAWTRFGVEFTLDWRSGGDYRAGDLVRDTSNSLLYVCTTAVTNSTQRPGLDTGHFTLLQSYLIGNGLGVLDNKIRWGYAGASLTNADTAINPGIFYCPISCANIPFDDAGILIVYKNGLSTATQGFSYVQVFNSINGNVPYIAYRISSSSSGSSVTWNNWRTLSNFDSLDFVSGHTYNQGQLVRGSNNIHYVKKTAASVCTTEPNSDSTNFESLAANLVKEGLTVNSTGDLTWGASSAKVTDCDEQVTCGVYFCDTSVENTPINAAGMLIVLGTSANNAGTSRGYYQLYVSGSVGDSGNRLVYLRTKNSGTSSNWNEWGLVGNEEVSASDLAGNGLTAASNKLNWGTASNVTNANNVTTPGTYALTSSSTNTPVKGGIMFVVANPSGKVMQIIFDPATGNTYQRDNTGSTWSNWRNQSYNVGATASHGSTFAFGAVHTAPSDGWIRCAAYSNWRANTVGTLYINGIGIATNHTGQYGSGGQSSGVETFMFIKAGDTFKCDQGSLEQLAFYAVQ